MTDRMERAKQAVNVCSRCHGMRVVDDLGVDVDCPECYGSGVDIEPAITAYHEGGEHSELVETLRAWFREEDGTVLPEPRARDAADAIQSLTAQLEAENRRVRKERQRAEAAEAQRDALARGLHKLFSLVVAEGFEPDTGQPHPVKDGIRDKIIDETRDLLEATNETSEVE